MNRKVILIIIASFSFLVVLSFVLYGLLSPTQSLDEDEFVTLPEVSDGERPELEVVVPQDAAVRLLDGGYLPMFQALERTEVEMVDPTTYLIDQNTGGDGEYQIFYYSSFYNITISLLSEPLATARLAAERSLLDATGFTLEQLCNVAVTVTTPLEVSEQYSGQDLGLSFCEGSIILP